MQPVAHAVLPLSPSWLFYFLILQLQQTPILTHMRVVARETRLVSLTVHRQACKLVCRVAGQADLIRRFMQYTAILALMGIMAGQTVAFCRWVMQPELILDGPQPGFIGMTTAAQLVLARKQRARHPSSAKEHPGGLTSVRLLARLKHKEAVALMAGIAVALSPDRMGEILRLRWRKWQAILQNRHILTRTSVRLPLLLPVSVFCSTFHLGSATLIFERWHSGKEKGQQIMPSLT